MILIFGLFSFVEHHDKLNDMIQQLTLSLSGVKHEQEYMQVRDRVHRASKLLQFHYWQVIQNSSTL